MFSIVRLVDSDRQAFRNFWADHWGDEIMVAHGTIFRPDDLEGFIALDGSEWVGLITYYIEAGFCEVLSIDSLKPGTGIGTALLKSVEKAARQAGCQVIRLITTNDNTRALRFYQKHGFELVGLHCRAVIESRKLKPSIPQCGQDGIPIRDEIELELRLAPPNPDLCT